MHCNATNQITHEIAFPRTSKILTILERLPPTNTVRMIPLYNIHAFIHVAIVYMILTSQEGTMNPFLLSSPELRVQELFWSPVVLLFVCLFVCVCCFHISPEPRDQFQSILIQSILGWSGFKFIQMKETTLLQEKVIQHNSPQNTYKYEISNTTLSISTKHYLNWFGKMKGLSPLQWEIIKIFF